MRYFLISLMALAVSASQTFADPSFWKFEWPQTDFTKTSVKWTEVMSGGPPKDGIPAIDNPKFTPVSAEARIKDNEPVMTVEMAGEARAYPIRYLMWHEIVNDRIGNVPVTVTFCPLCNSGIVFDGRLNGQELTFGVSGKLRNSDMVMYDRQSESWWQQFTGQGIVGDMLGKELTRLPGWMESWSAFKARNPNGKVMAQPGFNRHYGMNPYAKYDSSERPFLYNGEMPPHDISPLARVVAVGDRAWPLQRLVEAGKINEGGLQIEWSAGTASALDRGDIYKSKDVGAVRVKDKAGRDVAHDVAFAFAFHAFHPDGRWMLGK